VPHGWVHTIHRAGAWINEIEGSGAVGRRYEQQADAVPAGRRHAMAQRTEHVIHNADGTVAERNSYAINPIPPTA
jgi:Uncharacterized protein conserved in bacteria (DUF2188)